MRVESAFWRRLAYAGARYGPEPWVRYSPALFGLLFAAALPRHRNAVRSNLRRVTGRRSSLSERVDVVRTFVAYAHCLAESLASDRPEAVACRPAVSGLKHFEAALSERRGVVLVTAHSGVWDVTARLLQRRHDVPVVVVMAAEMDPNARALHDAIRGRAGIRIQHVGGHPLDVLPLLGHLRRGGVVAIQLDRVGHAAATLPVQLFGEPAAVPRGPFDLARVAGSPIIPIFSHRRGYFDYEVALCPPIRVDRGAREDELTRAAQSAAAELERFVKENPTQWFHFAV